MSNNLTANERWKLNRKLIVRLYDLSLLRPYDLETIERTHGLLHVNCVQMS